MIIKYEFCGDDIHPADDFDYEVDNDELHDALYDIMMDKDIEKQELVDYILFNCDKDDLCLYFERELREAFEDAAHEEYTEEL